eukprot:9040006-Pyramimonas_sp.AAC.1
MQWMLRAMVNGYTQQLRHDGAAWEEGSELAEPKPLATKSMLLWVKGDLMEHAKSLGLSLYSQYYSPCAFCEC